ncbi:hypothetical protein CRM22_010539 [Opisthorchis felineus]|uniref:Uncharacterized protein n=1 Tax=Opisthorchis felineus TaxID=147828 RepID=A0A4S2L338_OPIFE|nr:hypothetical protein CRM22_010539 [Opisthorchis felineus]
MSWLTGLASKAENLLNTIDSTAADALKSSPLRHTPGPRNDEDGLYTIPSESRSQTSDYPIIIPTFDADSDRRQEHVFPPESQKRLPTSTAFPRTSTPTTPKKPSDHDERILSDPFTFLNDSTTTLLSVPTTTELHTTSSPSSVDADVRTASSGYQTMPMDKIPEADSQPLIVTQTGGGTTNSHESHLAPSHTKITQSRQSTSDLVLENKILRSEVSSLSQEVSGLLRRNHKATEENKELRGQTERLENKLRDSDSRLRELHVRVKELEISTPDKNMESLNSRLVMMESELNDARRQLEVKQEALVTMETNMHDFQRQAELAEKRIQLAQQQTARITQELAQYKEKATRILNMKEQLIASLRGETAGRGSETQISDTAESESSNMILTLRAECDMLHEESSRWRIEVEHRETAMQELEMQMQTEREALRHNLELAEQRAEREKQLREDADSELAVLRKRQRDLEDASSKQRAELHGQLVASEAELARLRQLMTRRPVSSSDGQSSPTTDNNSMVVTRTDPAHILTLESRLRQLTDTLLSRQDALDSVLAQNHALKIRLERAKADNETLATALAVEDSQSNTRVRLPFHQAAGGYGCARLALHNSVIPRPLHPVASFLDSAAVRVTNVFRRWPLTRMIFLVYFILLHLWLLLASVIFLPSTTNIS